MSKDRFLKVAKQSYSSLKKTNEYKECCKQLKQKGYHKKIIDLELEREVLRGKFIDFDTFYKDMTGFRGHIRNMF